nr:uncharacterized protein LOC124807501 isoform X3 [Hydra vulgaris]
MMSNILIYRHNWFIAGGEDKKNLSNGDLLSLLSEDQSHDLFNAFVLAFNKLKDSDYVFKVLMPESIVFLFANASNVSRIKAEVALSAYISERDKKRFCSSPEAYCRTGKTGIQSIFTFHLIFVATSCRNKLFFIIQTLNTQKEKN